MRHNTLRYVISHYFQSGTQYRRKDGTWIDNIFEAELHLSKGNAEHSMSRTEFSTNPGLKIVPCMLVIETSEA